MKSNVLKKVEKALKNYFTFRKSDAIIAVSLDKADLPFAHIIEDTKAYPDSLLIAFDVSFPICDVAANLVLEVNAIKNVIITENFYFSQTGEMLWGDEAFDRFKLDNFVDLESLQAASEELN
jgi:hypothetical protein